MKIHIVTVGKPKLTYAQEGWHLYLKRLKRFHQVRITHIPDRNDDTLHILQAIGKGHLIALVIDADQKSSEELAEMLEEQALSGKEVNFVIGGPEGLPQEVIDRAGQILSLSKLTLPHDLAMVVLLEALYRASMINAGRPYHK